MMKSKYSIVAVLLLPLFVFGCQDERKETPTKGRTTVVVSESVAPMIQQEKLTFEELYQEAHVELQTSTAREAIARLFNDSIMVIVSSRPLNDEERAIQHRANIILGEYKIAIDGIAVIVHPGNTITQLRTTQLDSILTGKTTSWKSLGSDLASHIETCLPSRNTGTFETTISKIVKNDSVATPAFVTASSMEMINYVAAHPNAIGFVGLDWLNPNKEKVKTLELSDPSAPDSLGIKGKYFGPHPAYIYQGYYPLARGIYMYSRADNYGVSAGFITFITSGPGQKIVLGSGLVPATMPVRLVETTSKSIGTTNLLQPLFTSAVKKN